MARRSVNDVIETAISLAKIDHPDVGYGTTWDQRIMTHEESALLTKAVLLALQKEGYLITPREDDI
jgi:hypothetical protein